MRRVILAAVSTIAGLYMLLSFKTRPAPAGAALPAAGPSTTTSPVTSPVTSPETTTTNGSSTVTVTGAAAQTKYGPVQVQITVSNGQLTSVDAIDYPIRSPKDQQINSYAIPELNKEARAAKSARIDMVSGATYTSTGYINSLQSALNQAGL